jgi:hypothetical protein
MAMQKVLIVIVLMLVTVSINILVTDHLVDRSAQQIRTSKIIVLDRAELLETLRSNGDEIQSIKDYESIMSLLRARGYVVFNKSNVLTHAEQYDLPEFNMAQVEATLKERGISIMSDEAAQARLDRAANMLRRDFNISR